MAKEHSHSLYTIAAVFLIVFAVFVVLNWISPWNKPATKEAACGELAAGEERIYEPTVGRLEQTRVGVSNIRERPYLDEFQIQQKGPTAQVSMQHADGSEETVIVHEGMMLSVDGTSYRVQCIAEGTGGMRGMAVFAPLAANPCDSLPAGTMRTVSGAVGPMGGIGNIWERTYMDEMGMTRTGMTAQLSLFDGGNVILHPGMTVEAGGTAYRILCVDQLYVAFKAA